MRAHARERIPSATAAYLEAYAAIELSAREAQTLVDTLITITVALTDTGTRLRGDAWKFARINELSSTGKRRRQSAWPINTPEYNAEGRPDAGGDRGLAQEAQLSPTALGQPSR